MKRPCLYFVVAMAAVRALHATPVAFASCTLGDTTVEQTTSHFASCYLPLPSGDFGVSFDTTIDRVTSYNGLTVSANLGGVVNNNFLGDLIGFSVGRATDRLSLITPGPPRLGIIQFSYTVTPFV